MMFWSGFEIKIFTAVMALRRDRLRSDITLDFYDLRDFGCDIVLSSKASPRRSDYVNSLFMILGELPILSNMFDIFWFSRLCGV